jgi:hypothetical protein
MATLEATLMVQRKRTKSKALTKQDKSTKYDVSDWNDSSHESPMPASLFKDNIVSVLDDLINNEIVDENGDHRVWIKFQNSRIGILQPVQDIDPDLLDSLSEAMQKTDVPELRKRWAIVPTLLAYGGALRFKVDDEDDVVLYHDPDETFHSDEWLENLTKQKISMAAATPKDVEGVVRRIISEEISPIVRRLDSVEESLEPIGETLGKLLRLLPPEGVVGSAT